MSEKPTVCKHGSLRRSCEICDLVQDLDQMEDALKAVLKDLHMVNRTYPGFSNACIKSIHLAEAALGMKKDESYE